MIFKRLYCCLNDSFTSRKPYSEFWFQSFWRGHGCYRFWWWVFGIRCEYSQTQSSREHKRNWYIRFSAMRVLSLIIFSFSHLINFLISNFSYSSGTYSSDYYGRCRWSINTGESLIFVKYDMNKLNIIDTEKKVLTLKQPLQVDTSNFRKALFSFLFSICFF